jgi:polyhydroxybutyrate depolymerase
MSNGGFMSYQLACSLGNRIAAIASVTGSMTNTMFDNCNPIKSIPLLEIHGDADLVVPYTGSALTGAKPISQILSFWINQNNCPANPATTNVPDIVNTDSSTVTEYSYKPCNESEILHYKVSGGGHCWPGSATAPGLGPTNMDIDASKEIWKFFSRYGTPTTLGLNEQLRSKELVVSPNPNNGKFSIQISDDEISNISLFDISGRLLFSEKTNHGSRNIYFDLFHLEKGMYLLNVTGNNAEYAERIIVR